MVVGVAAICAHIVLSGGGLRWLAMGFLVVPALAWAWLNRGQQRSPGRVWVAATAVCLIVSTYGFDFVIPQFANWRSSSRGAAIAQQQLHNPAPVVYFGRHKYGASFSIERGDVREFDTAQLDSFEKYMAKHPQAVVVANRNGAEMIRNQCQQSINLAKSPVHGKVYVASAAEGAAQVARREPVTQIR